MAGLGLRWLTCLGAAGPQDRPGWQGFQEDGGFWFPEGNTEPPGGGVEEKGQVLKGVSRAGVTLMRPSCRICFPFPGGSLLRPAGDSASPHPRSPQPSEAALVCKSPAPSGPGCPARLCARQGWARHHGGTWLGHAPAP